MKMKQALRGWKRIVIARPNGRLRQIDVARATHREKMQWWIQGRRSVNYQIKHFGMTDFERKRGLRLLCDVTIKADGTIKVRTSARKDIRQRLEHLILSAPFDASTPPNETIGALAWRPDNTPEPVFAFPPESAE